MQGESSKSSEFHTTILYDGKRKTLRRYFSPRLAKAAERTSGYIDDYAYMT